MRTVMIGVVLLVSLLWFGLANAISGESAFTLGYGFGIGNGSDIGRIENGLHYDFAQPSYVYERAFTERLNLGLEPFVNIDNRPDWGAGYRSGLCERQVSRAGCAYALYSARRDRVPPRPDFCREQFLHYSNGGLALPNRSVNANILRIWYYS